MQAFACFAWAEIAASFVTAAEALTAEIAPIADTEQIAAMIPAITFVFMFVFFIVIVSFILDICQGICDFLLFSLWACLYYNIPTITKPLQKTTNFKIIYKILKKLKNSKKEDAQRASSEFKTILFYSAFSDDSAFLGASELSEPVAFVVAAGIASPVAAVLSSGGI